MLFSMRLVYVCARRQSRGGGSWRRCMRAFEYASSTGLDEALRSMDGDTVRLLAGGTDLLPLMKLDVVRPQRLVDLKHVPELQGGIQQSADGVSIGALTTLSHIESSEVLKTGYAALLQAAGLAATPQLRNMATLAGNSLQRPRCWYYRSSQFHCWLKGGEMCHGRDGQNQCVAVFGQRPWIATHPSYPPAALLFLDALTQVFGSAHSRCFPFHDSFKLPSHHHR